MPLLFCVSAGAHPQTASETRAIRTRAGPLGIRPFSRDTNKACYQKRKNNHIGTVVLLSIEVELTAVSRVKELKDAWEYKFRSFFWSESKKSRRTTKQQSVSIFFLEYIKIT